ncbi:MAG: 16S rRNA (guanine(527)-N(7))-methyltransferase RsmG [Ruminiclostridium sp.]|jgi:16S rRNA (guanine527-N7)-methyltransferase|nr:16S rRNA (guanine(527)-N(7))-methyltransferase RsmG [Ruminiclostridium sp.]
MSPELTETLAAGLTALGLSPAPAALDQLGRYCDLLLEKNQVMNLTAVTEPAQVVRRHFLDSAALLPTRALQGKTVVDVGTGAGFPGLVLAILDPSAHITLLDSQGKRLDWLAEVVGELGLDNVTILQGRAEELGLDKEQRERYDTAVSRAVAALPVLAELCLPLVKPGGLFLAMKSNKTDEEIEAAAPIIQTLGGEPPFVMDYRLPGSEAYQRIVTVLKARPTPPGYPRRWSKIKNG